MSNDTLMDRLFEALPRRGPVPLKKKIPGSYFPMTRWPLSSVYNGFSGAERRREHQLQVLLTRAGILPSPVVCDVCGSEQSVSFHAENYYDIFQSLHLCKRCHYAIHRRHWYQSPWPKIVDQNARTGDEWFSLIPRTLPEKGAFDFAGYLRRRFGEAYALVEDNAVRCCPPLDGHLPDGLLPIDYVEGQNSQPGSKPAPQMDFFASSPIKPVNGLYGRQITDSPEDRKPPEERSVFNTHPSGVVYRSRQRKR